MWQGLLILYLVSFVLGVLVVVRVWRANTLDGVLTLFVPFYAFYALYKYWGDPEHDIRWLVLAQAIAAALLVWNVSHVKPAPAERDRLAAEQARGSFEGDRKSDDRAANPASTPTPNAGAPTTAQAQPAAEPPQRATPAELRWLAEHLAFLRGRFTREAIGMRLDIPHGQHLLAGADARRADAALRGEDDTHLIGWMIDENKNVTDANLRIVRLRWRHDGLVIADSAPLDPALLLDAARAQPRVARLAGRSGTLLRYVEEPQREGSTVVWSEERQPDGAAASVYDCHALRLARKGVLELSIIGADAKAAKSCSDELRALVASVHFEADADYPAQVRGERLAPYSLSGLIAQTQ